MKKRVIGTVLAVSLMALGGYGLTGCGTEEKTETVEDIETSGEDTQEDNKEETEEKEGVHTVTFYDSDATTVLDEVQVEDGAVVEEFIPEKEGYVFSGWFATPQMSHKFDFSKAITEDLSLFAGFVSYVEDTRSFAILGSGSSPVLMESNWGKVIGEAQTMTKEEVTGANVYSITVDLMEGDEFQFAVDSSWSDQRGYGYLAAIEQDGVEYFENAGGLGENAVKKANIKVKVAGNYTFSLTTYPGEDTYDTEDAYYTEEGKENFNYNAYDTITWTYNGESESDGVEYQTDYYIKGAIVTDWQDVYTEEMKFVEENGVYTLTIDLTEGDEFLFTTLLTSGDTQSIGNEYVRFINISEDDSESLSYVSGTESANMVAQASGTYTFTYDASTKILTVAFK